MEQTIDTVPEGCKTGNICADLHLTPDGKYLYGSNRGHDSLAAFSIDQETGRLTLLHIIPCGGKTPRNFCMEESGAFLVVGNQDTDNIVVFRINALDGSLTKASELSLPSPVCIRQVPEQ